MTNDDVSIISMFQCVSPANLARGLELIGAIYGHGLDPMMVVMAMVKHNSPIVREGAALGLGHANTPQALFALRRMSIDDQSDAVRSVAADILDWDGV